MKRQIILLFILLLVTTQFSACTTSTTSTTPSSIPLDVDSNKNVSRSETEESSPPETIAVEIQERQGNQPEAKLQVAKKPGAGREADKLLSSQSASNNVKTEHQQSSKRKRKDDSAVATLQEAEAAVGAAAVSPQTFATGDSSSLMRMVAPSGIAPNVQPAIRWPSEPLDRESYAEFKENPVMLVAEHPVSTFSIDVDTGSYTNTRRILREGRLPAKNVVRVEEFINYFNYDYPAPESGATPFNVITEIGPTPWNAKTNLLHIGIKGYEIAATALPATNLVFLVDVSGSMHSQNKLPLLKKSLQLLTQKLRAQDRISLVVYAGASGTVLEPTSGADKAVILEALESLSAGGSTNGAAGIRLAYLKAQQAYIPNGVNRVILATDGDFNVGTTNFDALKSLAEEKRKSGIFLTTLGFGSGNYNDRLMEQLADVGNGNYAYVDGLMEAQKVLVTEMGSTLNTIAKDVKIQIEFNPAVVAEYRLIGYENRALRREDFNNDKIDAGEIGAGHTVTAIYEVALVNKGGNLIDPLRYQSSNRNKPKAKTSTQELAFLRLRYKHPDSDQSILMETPVDKNLIVSDMARMSKRYQFSASVAGFAQLLRGGQFTQQYSFSDVASMAVASKGIDRYGYRGEFVRLVELANTLSGNAMAPVREKALN